MNQALNKNNLPGFDEAYSTPLEDLDVSNPLIWPEQKMWAIFERLQRRSHPLLQRAWMSDQRPEDMEPVGPYWSITRYEDIMAIDTDHHRFSSEPAIVLPNPAEDFPLPMFIAMDQPKHDIQRQTVAPIVASKSLSQMQELIRERTQYVQTTCRSTRNSTGSIRSQSSSLP